MILSYTIANERISFKERNNGYGDAETLQYPGPLQIRIKKSCSHDLSILNIDGRMMVETDINYHPAEGIGILACIQQVDNPGCMVFSADQNFALNCSPKITDILFIQSHIPFTYKYADRSVVKRVDMFMYQKEAERLLSPSLLNTIDEHDMVSIKADSKDKAVEELLQTINKKIQGEHLCKYLHELLVCLNETGKWRSRF
jgi:hypothetical protein